MHGRARRSTRRATRSQSPARRGTPCGDGRARSEAATSPPTSPRRLAARIARRVSRTRTWTARRRSAVPAVAVASTPAAAPSASRRRGVPVPKMFAGDTPGACTPRRGRTDSRWRRRRPWLARTRRPRRLTLARLLAIHDVVVDARSECRARTFVDIDLNSARRAAWRRDGSRAECACGFVRRAPSAPDDKLFGGGEPGSRPLRRRVARLRSVRRGSRTHRRFPSRRRRASVGTRRRRWRLVRGGRTPHPRRVVGAAMRARVDERRCARRARSASPRATPWRPRGRHVRPNRDATSTTTSGARRRPRTRVARPRAEDEDARGRRVRGEVLGEASPAPSSSGTVTPANQLRRRSLAGRLHPRAPTLLTMVPAQGTRQHARRAGQRSTWIVPGRVVGRVAAPAHRRRDGRRVHPEQDGDHRRAVFPVSMPRAPTRRRRVVGVHGVPGRDARPSARACRAALFTPGDGAATSAPATAAPRLLRIFARCASPVPFSRSCRRRDGGRRRGDDLDDVFPRVRRPSWTRRTSRRKSLAMESLCNAPPP